MDLAPLLTKLKPPGVERKKTGSQDATWSCKTPRYRTSKRNPNSCNVEQEEKGSSREVGALGREEDRGSKEVAWGVGSQRKGVLHFNVGGRFLRSHWKGERAEKGLEGQSLLESTPRAKSLHRV